MKNRLFALCALALASLVFVSCTARNKAGEKAVKAEPVVMQHSGCGDCPGCDSTAVVDSCQRR